MAPALHGWAFDVAPPPPCALEEVPEFQIAIFQCVVCLGNPYSLGICVQLYDHLDLPTLQQIHELYKERVHFIVPFDESNVPPQRLN